MNRTRHNRRTPAQALGIDNRKLFLYGSIAIILGSIVLYLMLVYHSIVNAAVARDIEQKTAVIVEDIAALELDYIEAEQTLSLDYAYELGFRTITDRSFVKIDRNLSRR